MKKILLFIMTAALLTGFAGAYAQTAEAHAIKGLVTGVAEDGTITLQTEDMGTVEALVNDATSLETPNGVAEGDYIYIDYDGKTTRSIPVQITAQRVACYTLEGSIASRADDYVTLNTAEMGEVIVALPEGVTQIDGNTLRVWYDGAIATSLPARISAGYVLPAYAEEGIVRAIDEEGMLLDWMETTLRVHIAQDASLPEEIREGDAVRVYYDGMMTRSIPAQITAYQVLAVTPFSQARPTT